MFAVLEKSNDFGSGISKEGLPLPLESLTDLPNIISLNRIADFFQVVV
jgi:hypothetical protein